MRERSEYREFSPATSHNLPVMKLGECIANTVLTALSEQLGYAEGIARHPDLGIWYRHAWNVNQAGEAVDVTDTWAVPGTRYIGREYTVTEVIELAGERGIYNYADPIGPAVPAGEFGIDCYNEPERAWLAEQAERRATRR